MLGLSFLCAFSLVCSVFGCDTSAIGCLERLVYEVTCYVLSGT